jgi:hypothetical protein
MRDWRIWAYAIVFTLPAEGIAQAQTDFQLWGNVTLERLASDRVTFGLDIEPKIRLGAPAGESWGELGATPSVDYVAKNWADLTGEVYTGYTRQNDQLTSSEVTPRVGVRFHVWSRELATVFKKGLAGRERPPKRRLVIRDYVRVEWRTLFYSGTTPTSSTWRFRNRLETLFPLNHRLITEDDTRYLLGDWEWFIPVSDATEQYASRQRIRVGVGYRWDVHWRTEGLYVWDKSHNTTQGGFSRSDSAIDIRLTRVFE